MIKPLLAALLSFLPMRTLASDFSLLQSLNALGIRATTTETTAVPQPKASANFRVSDNPPLLADFTAHLDYRGTNGQTIFPYAMRNVRFYKLTGWPRHLLVQLEDRTLPDFHNFLVLSLHGNSDTGYAKLLTYDSGSSREKYTASTVPESICSLDPGCDRINAAKKDAEKEARASVTAWEAPHFDSIKALLLNKISGHYDSGKFRNLGGAEVAAAKSRVSGALSRTPQAGDGKSSLIAANNAEWRLEHCGASSAELLERVRQAPPQEQDRILLRCGLVLDAEWLIKNEYDSAAIAALNGACPANPASPAGYCPAFSEWLRVYPAATGLKELQLTDGWLAI